MGLFERGKDPGPVAWEPEAQRAEQTVSGLLIDLALALSPSPELAGLRAYLRSHWVFNAHHADAREFIENVILVVPVGLRAAGEVTVGHTDGTEPVTGHGLDHLLHHLISVTGPEDTGLPRPTKDLAAPGGGKGRR